MGTEAGSTWSLAHGRSVRLDRPRLMAVLNLTPDSFYAGSRVGSAGEAAERAQRAVDEGADVLDLGGESTRPGAPRVPAGEQIRRVVGAVEAIRSAGGVLGETPISVDTTLAEVAEVAIEAGADAINDVAAARESPRILELAAQSGAGLVLMHRLHPPDADSFSDCYEAEPRYEDVVREVAAFLGVRLGEAQRAGVGEGQVLLDPGLGFGKTVAQNYELIRRTGELLALGRPVLSALSRKSFIGRVASGAGSDPGDRLSGTLAASLAHVRAGAMLLRVHDVGAHAEALAVWRACEGESGGVGSG